MKVVENLAVITVIWRLRVVLKGLFGGSETPLPSDYRRVNVEIEGWGYKKCVMIKVARW